MPVRLPVLTNSQAKTFRRCRREHYIEYELLIRPVAKADALRFGTLVHLGLEEYWNALAALMVTDAALDAAYAKMRADESDPFDLVRAEELLRGYAFRWESDVKNIIAVEKEFVCDLINPMTGAASRTFALGGKIDALIAETIGVYHVEHKTSGEDISAGSNYWKRLKMDPQISTYFVGARSLGHDVAGCLYDVIGKPQLRQASVPLVDDEGVKIVLDSADQRVRTKDGKRYRQTGDTELGYALQTRPETSEEFRSRLRDHIAENPDRYYQRGTVVRLEEEEIDAAFDLWQMARELREAQLAKRWPRNPDACVRYGRTCSYFEVCCGEASLDDPTLFRKIEYPHEELIAANEPEHAA